MIDDSFIVICINGNQTSSINKAEKWWKEAIKRNYSRFFGT